MRNSICTAAKLYLHGNPTFPSPPEVPRIANPAFAHSHAFAPRQHFPQRIRSPETKTTTSRSHYHSIIPTPKNSD